MATVSGCFALLAEFEVVIIVSLYFRLPNFITNQVHSAGHKRGCLSCSASETAIPSGRGRVGRAQGIGLCRSTPVAAGWVSSIKRRMAGYIASLHSSSFWNSPHGWSFRQSGAVRMSANKAVQCETARAVVANACLASAPWL
jgi:hypothetical protein